MKKPLISVVINTRNEEKTLPRALRSIKGWAEEIVVVDMESSDETVVIAKKAGARVFSYPAVGYVEPARNFALSKAQGKWILLLDADEEVSVALKKALSQIVETDVYSYVSLPRKNMMFGKWIEHSRWWPDYNIRFFKKDTVIWQDAIHSVPMTKGEGWDIPAPEDLALQHHHYTSVSQFVERLNRYTDHQVVLLHKEGYTWEWHDLVRKPLAEFLSRFFAGHGYKDGVHGLAVCSLQAFSEFVLYLKIWESQGFKAQTLSKKQIKREVGLRIGELAWWMWSISNRIQDKIRWRVIRFFS